MDSIARVVLACPTEQIEGECANRVFKQSDVALTYALAMRDEDIQPVDWRRANAAILARWSKSGLERVKRMAWARFKTR